MSEPIDTIARMKPAIQQWVRGWMNTPDTVAHGATLGLRGDQQFWIVGRAGVLGDADVEVAIGGLAFLAPAVVRPAWEQVPAGLDRRAIAAEYASRAVAWGERELPRFGDDRLDRLDQLARRVVDAADPSLGSVFAGWRAMPAPVSAAGRVALTMHVLRELRGAAHIVAVNASGITPLHAILSSLAPAPRTGAPWAAHLGWSGPFPDPAAFLTARARSEELTNEILVPSFSCLDQTELAELADLCTSIRAAIDM